MHIVLSSNNSDSCNEIVHILYPVCQTFPFQKEQSVIDIMQSRYP